MVENREACEYFANVKKIKAFQSLMDNWDEITEILSILKIPYDVTIASQNAAYTLSDFFLSWLRMKIKLDNIIKKGESKTDFVEHFREFLDQREKILLDHPLMLCAIYLDPRVRFALKNDDLIRIAKLKLVDLLERVETLKKETATEEDRSTEGDKTVAGDSFDEFVKTMTVDPEAEAETSQRPMSGGQLLVLLEAFEQTTPFLHHKESIQKFWENQKEIFPFVYELASIVNAIPPTQTTVERAFSIMGFVFDCKRSNMSDRTLQTILTIRLNKDLLEPIFLSDLLAADQKQ